MQVYLWYNLTKDVRSMWYNIKNMNPKIKGGFIALIFSLALYIYFFGFEMLIGFQPFLVGLAIVVILIKLCDV